MCPGLEMPVLRHDSSLLDWPENDFRIFVGDLGNETNDDVLTRAFNKYPTFNKARVVRDKRSNKTKGAPPGCMCQLQCSPTRANIKCCLAAAEHNCTEGPYTQQLETGVELAASVCKSMHAVDPARSCCTRFGFVSFSDAAAWLLQSIFAMNATMHGGLDKETQVAAFVCKSTQLTQQGAVM